MKILKRIGAGVVAVLRPLTPVAARKVYHRHKRLKYIEGLNVSIDLSRRTILAINHHCDQDYEAITAINRRFNIVEVVAGTLFMGSSNYFTDEVEFIHAPYDSEPESNRRAYRLESQLIYDRLRRRFPFDLIIVPNDNYFFLRELIDIAHGDGIPTVILDKEGTITPHSYHSESKRAREFTPLVADHVFVWSHRQKSFWQEKGVAADKITVVGQPRSDLLLQIRGNRLAEYFRKEQPLVTAFSYLDTAYMPSDYVAQRSASWRAMKDATHMAVGQLAETFPQFNFVIKCHPLQRDLDAVTRHYERDNLRVIGGSALGNELIQKSELIIAFQSTALIEAMLVGRNAIYTGWDPQIAELQEYLLPFHTTSGIVKAGSPEMLRAVAERYLSGDKSDFTFTDEELAKRREFVSTYLFRPDGHASERFLAEVERLLS